MLLTSSASTCLQHSPNHVPTIISPSVRCRRSPCSARSSLQPTYIARKCVAYAAAAAIAIAANDAPSFPPSAAVVVSVVSKDSTSEGKYEHGTAVGSQSHSLTRSANVEKTIKTTDRNSDARWQLHTYSPLTNIRTALTAENCKY